VTDGDDVVGLTASAGAAAAAAAASASCNHPIATQRRRRLTSDAGQ